MVRILGFHCNSPGEIPSQRTKIPQPQKKKKKMVLMVIQLCECIKNH